MRYALVALALQATATSIDMSLSSINSESLASEIAPLYLAAIVIFGTARLISAMFRRHEGLLVLRLSRI